MAESELWNSLGKFPWALASAAEFQNCTGRPNQDANSPIKRTEHGTKIPCSVRSLSLQDWMPSLEAILLQWRAGGRRRGAVRCVTNHTGLVREESTLARTAWNNGKTSNRIVNRRCGAVASPFERIAALRAQGKNCVEQARTSRASSAGICTAHGCQRRREAI